MKSSNESINLTEQNEEALNANETVTSELPYDLTEFGMGSFNFQKPEMPLPEEKTPFFKTAGLEALETSYVANLYKSGKNVLESTYNFLYDPVDESFDPADPDNYVGIPPMYHPTIRNATTPKDLIRRKELVAQEIENQKLLENGGFWAKLAGGAVGMTVGSPFVGFSKWVLPAVAQVRTGKVTIDAFTSAMKSAPGLAIDMLGYESALAFSKGKVQAEEIAINTLQDTMFGFGLSAVGKTLRYGSDGVKIWNARKVVEAEYYGARLEPVFDKKGNLEEVKFSIEDKEALSAKKVNNIERDLRNIVAETGFYGIPYVGPALKAVTKAINPAFRLKSSSFESVRDFSTALANTGIRTTEELEGVPRQVSAEERLDLFKAQATAYSLQSKQNYYESQNLTNTLDEINAIKMLKQNKSENKSFSYTEFGRRARNVAITGLQDENPGVNKEAQNMIAQAELINKLYAEATGNDLFRTPKNALNYGPQSYDLNKLDYDPEDFYSEMMTWMGNQNKRIEELTQPLKEIDEKILTLKSPQARKKYEERRSELQQELMDKISDDPDLHNLVTDRVILSTQQKKELRDLLQKFNYKELKKELEDLKNEKETKISAERKKEINARIKDIGAEIKDGFNSLRIDAELGRINKSLFYREKGEIKFHDPDKMYTFQTHYKTKKAQRNYIDRIRAKILGTNPAQLMDDLLGHAQHSGKPSYTKERSILIPQEILNNAGYLDNDLSAVMSNYIISMGRRIALKNALGEAYGADGLDGIIDKLSKEYDLKQKEIRTKEKDPKKRIKKLDKLKKEFNSNTKDMQNFYNIFNGNYEAALNSEGVDQGLQILRNMVVVAKNGLLPVAQMQDSVAAILRSGVSSWLFSGFLPHLTELKKKFQGQPTVMKEAAAVNLLGLNHAIASLQYDWFNGSTHNYNTMLGKAAKWSSWLAKKSQNITFANYYENLNESIAERTFQNDIIKYCQKFLDGTITKSETIQAARLGIDLAADAKGFVNQFNKYGETHYFGMARNSNYQNWDDADLLNKMVFSVRRGVADVVVKGGMYTSPLLMKNPIIGTITQFMSWAFAATDRYLIPSLQYSDGKVLQGIIAMQIVSCFQDPLRKILSGKEPFDDEQTAFNIMVNSAMQNGLLGILPNIIEQANLITNGDLLGKAQGFRYQDRPGLHPPALDLAYDTLGAVWMFASGKYSQSGMKKVAKISPFAGNWYIRGLINGAIEESDLPKSYKDAEPYGIFQ